MPIYAINARDLRQSSPANVISAARKLPEGAPIVVMIHGYGFSPTDPRRDPHRHILALDPSYDIWTAKSWPRALGFAGDNPGEGIGIGFAWEATGIIHRVYDRAEIAAQRLARLISDLSAAADRPVAIIGHSMGCRVALRALRHLHAGRVSRMVLLAAAEFRSRALEAMTSPAGRAAEVINVTTRENDVYDWLMEVGMGGRHAQTLGNGLGRELRNWVDLQIDAPEVIAALEACGYPCAAAVDRISHFSCYLRDGLFDFYRIALRQPGRLPLPYLAQQIPARQAPRWSRLLARPEWRGFALPFFHRSAD